MKIWVDQFQTVSSGYTVFYVFPNVYLHLFIYLFIIESYRKYTTHTHTHKRREKKEEKERKKKPLTIKHHTVGLVSAQKSNNVIYSITEITR